jgi:hypothetical protein
MNGDLAEALEEQDSEVDYTMGSDIDSEVEEQDNPIEWTPAEEVDYSSEKYQVMGPLTEEEYAGLKSSIQDDGVDPSNPVVVDEDGYVLEGHHTAQACDELDIEEIPVVRKTELSESEKRDYAYSRNMSRRHMGKAAKFNTTQAYLMEDHVSPDTPQNEVAEFLSVGQSTVSRAKTELAKNEEVVKYSVGYLPTELKKDKARDILSENPDVTTTDLADESGLSRHTARKVRKTVVAASFMTEDEKIESLKREFEEDIEKSPSELSKKYDHHKNSVKKVRSDFRRPENPVKASKQYIIENPDAEHNEVREETGAWGDDVSDAEWEIDKESVQEYLNENPDADLEDVVEGVDIVSRLRDDSDYHRKRHIKNRLEDLGHKVQDGVIDPDPEDRYKTIATNSPDPKTDTSEDASSDEEDTTTEPIEQVTESIQPRENLKQVVRKYLEENPDASDSEVRNELGEWEDILRSEDSIIFEVKWSMELTEEQQDSTPSEESEPDSTSHEQDIVPDDSETEDDDNEEEPGRVAKSYSRDFEPTDGEISPARLTFRNGLESATSALNPGGENPGCIDEIREDFRTWLKLSRFDYLKPA